MSFGNNGNDLYLFDAGQNNVMRFVDWFQNLEVEQFTFADTGNSYSAQDVLSLFGTPTSVEFAQMA